MEGRKGKMEKRSDAIEYVCKYCGSRFAQLSNPIPDRCPACQMSWEI